ncbi:MAG: rhodanese-like domain-containing protein [Dermatophilaceae bacterium]
MRDDRPQHRSVDDLLVQARRRLHRLAPQEVSAARQAGAVVVDIRPRQQRDRFGQLPFAMPVERNVLEWRLDPACPAALPYAACDLHVVVLCQEGYASSLAAASLQDLGIHRATDVIGGYAAWARPPGRT